MQVSGGRALKIKGISTKVPVRGTYRSTRIKEETGRKPGPER